MVRSDLNPVFISDYQLLTDKIDKYILFFSKSYFKTLYKLFWKDTNSVMILKKETKIQ